MEGANLTHVMRFGKFTARFKYFQQKLTALLNVRRRNILKQEIYYQN